MAASGGEQAVLSSNVCCVHSGIIIAWNWADGGTMPLLVSALHEQRYGTERCLKRIEVFLTWLYVYFYLAFTA